MQQIEGNFFMRNNRNLARLVLKMSPQNLSNLYVPTYVPFSMYPGALMQERNQGNEPPGVGPPPGGGK